MITLTLTHIVIKFMSVEFSKAGKISAIGYLCFGNDETHMVYNYVNSEPKGWYSTNTAGELCTLNKSFKLELGKASDRLKASNPGRLAGRSFRITDSTIEEIKEQENGK